MQITPVALEAIRRHLTAAYPLEGCGLLVGEPASVGGPLVTTAVQGNNQRLADGAAGRRYLISPDEFRAAEREAATLGLQVVGSYHSHPDVAASPSAYDREHAWPWYRYLIVSIVGGIVREERVWELSADRDDFIEHPLHAREY